MERIHYPETRRSSYDRFGSTHSVKQIAAAPQPPNKSNSTVLILEDFDAIRALLSDHFKHRGYEVFSSATLAGALAMTNELARTNGAPPDILFIDYDLTDEDPFIAIHELRTSLPHSTIVMMGGPSAPQDQDRALRAGASWIMEKAYDLASIDQIACGETPPHHAYLHSNVA